MSCCNCRNLNGHSRLHHFLSTHITSFNSKSCIFIRLQFLVGADARLGVYDCLLMTNMIWWAPTPLHAVAYDGCNITAYSHLDIDTHQ